VSGPIIRRADGAVWKPGLRARKGTDHISNLVGACQECNTKKGSMSAVEFMKTFNTPA
jgi:5-methylcytosine-specific restriction endonuclease McrA